MTMDRHNPHAFTPGRDGAVCRCGEDHPYHAQWRRRFPEPERPDSLDAAWSEAEAALPEGWLLTIKDWSRTGDPEMAGPDGWDDGEIEAWAAHWADPERSIQGQGPTPAAALRSLAAKLRERAG